MPCASTVYQSLSVHFRALTNVDLIVSDGERRAVIGPNGAGKVHAV